MREREKGGVESERDGAALLLLLGFEGEREIGGLRVRESEAMCGQSIDCFFVVRRRERERECLRVRERYGESLRVRERGRGRKFEGQRERMRLDVIALFLRTFF